MKAISNFIPMKMSGMNCFDSSLTSIVDWERGEHYKPYMYSWRFHFSDLEGETDEYRDIVDRIYGISVKHLNEKNFELVYEIIHSELEHNRVVMIKCDEYFCPWMYNFEKNHIHEHIYIITGETAEGFNCVDAFPYAVDKFISYEYFEKGYMSLYVYMVSTNHADCKEKGRAYLKECVWRKHIFDEINVNEMDILINHIRENQMMDLLEKKENVWDTTFYKFVDRLYGGRTQFCEFLKEIADDDPCILDFVEQMQNIVNEYVIVLSLITKIFLAQRETEKGKSKIVSHLECIVEAEKQLLAKMKDKSSYEKILLQEKVVMQHLDLKDLKNAKELFFDEEHIVTYKEIPVNQIWKVDDMTFDFQIYGTCDCICCDGQVVVLEPQKYSSVMFLGYATYEDQLDELTLVYSDQTTEKIDVEFADWSVEPRCGFVTAWEGKCKSLDTDDEYDGRIFGKKYRLPKKEANLEYMVLPKNLKSHIYAITMAHVSV